MVRLSNFLSAALLAYVSLDTAAAHPGEHEGRSAQQLARRSKFFEKAKRSLGSCSEKMKARGLEDNAIKRRSDWHDDLRARLALDKKAKYQRLRRDLATSLGTDHNQTGSVSFDETTDSATVFSGNVSCVIEPEVTQGPYYVDGELIRNDVRESEPGIVLYADLQFIDTNTCEPIPDLYLDWWHCNSTGVYAGVVAQGNGDSSDATNINNTALRGIAPTDSEGVVQFTSVFPGHYTGRATHVHILSHTDGEVLENGTYSGGVISHVGQLFFDQALIAEADTVSPYTDNDQALTLNSADSILAQSAAGDFDPVVEYVLLGDSIADGIFAWISIGVDTTAEYTVGSAATWTDHGGVVNANSGVGGPGGNGTMGGGGPGGNFTGAPPSGFSGTAPVTISASTVTEDTASSTTSTTETSISTEDITSTSTAASSTTTAAAAATSTSTTTALSGTPSHGAPRPGQQQPGHGQGSQGTRQGNARDERHG